MWEETVQRVRGSLRVLLQERLSRVYPAQGGLEERQAPLHEDLRRLLGPRELESVANLGQPDRAGMVAPIIDVLHRAATLWGAGDREALAELLAEGARGRREQLRLVAQTLINTLPDDDPERRLLEGFLAGRDVMTERPRQERLL